MVSLKLGYEISGFLCWRVNCNGSMNFDYENLDWQMCKYHRAQKMAMHGDSVFCVRRQQTVTFVNRVACMCLEGKL